jgi:hypothetical protein
MKHYKYSEKKAFEALGILSILQMEELRLAYETGGRN